MMNASQNEQRVPVRINGSRAMDAARPEFNELDRVLTGIALSDSPVLIRAKNPEDGALLAKRLHTLGRRYELELSFACSVDETRELAERGVSGTWTLLSVSDWREE